MATKPPEENGVVSLSFSDFPEDVQICILSFLTPAEISAFSCTSRRFVSLCRNNQSLWFSMCDRRWGSETLVKKWGNGKISYKLLYKTLQECENLIGFWRCSGAGLDSRNSGSLVFFEWGPFYVSGSWITPVEMSTFKVIKAPFLWMGINSKGEPVNYLDLESRLEVSENFMDSEESLSEIVPVNVNFIGKCHIAIEENMNFYAHNSCSPKNGAFMKVSSSGNMKEEEPKESFGSPGSPSDISMSDIYQYFANRTIRSGDGSWRRQRKREKERKGRRKWGTEHFVKIVNCSPTPARPLQGLWKGLSDDMSLEFYLVSYDEIGGVMCRRVGELSQLFSGCTPVFWTSSTTFVESPLSPDEQHIYESRIHLRQPLAEGDDWVPCADTSDVLRICSINSSYDLVIPDLMATCSNPQLVEGRIWLYKNGTFGYGFLRNNHIIDLNQIAKDGRILDLAQFKEC